MNFRMTKKQLIIANITLFVVSFVFLEYSKTFRTNQKLHWIYSSGHNWWLMITLTFCFWGSLILGTYSLWEVKENKFLYFISSILPLIILLILIFKPFIN